MAANWPLIERCNFDSNDGLWHYDLSAFYYLFEDEEIQDYRGALYEYDFEMHYPFLNNIKRNVATLIGRVVNYGEGQAFNINLHGEGRIGGN